MPKIKAVLFDLDGTLVDSFQDIADAVNYVLAELGKPSLSLDQVRRHVGHGLRETLRGSLGIENNEALDRLMKMFREYYWEHCLDNTHFYAGVMEGLRKLGNYRKAVVTNKLRKFAEKIITGLGAGMYFDAILGAEDYPALKPDPRALFSACDRLGVKAEEAVMVGDSASDMDCAVSAGAVPFAVTYGLGTVDELRAAGAFSLVNSLEILSDQVDAINKGTG